MDCNSNTPATVATTSTSFTQPTTTQAGPAQAQTQASTPTNHKTNTLFLCSRCGHFITNPNAHMLRHTSFDSNNATYRCTICSVGFNNRNSFETHCTRIHERTILPNTVIFSFHDLATAQQSPPPPALHFFSRQQPQSHHQSQFQLQKQPHTRLRQPKRPVHLQSTSWAPQTSPPQQSAPPTKPRPLSCPSSPPSQAPTAPSTNTNTKTQSSRKPYVRKYKKCGRCHQDYDANNAKDHFLKHSDFDLTGDAFLPWRCESCQLAWFGQGKFRLTAHLDRGICDGPGEEVLKMMRESGKPVRRHQPQSQLVRLEPPRSARLQRRYEESTSPDDDEGDHEDDHEDGDDEDDEDDEQWGGNE